MKIYTVSLMVAVVLCSVGSCNIRFMRGQRALLKTGSDTINISSLTVIEKKRIDDSTLCRVTLNSLTGKWYVFFISDESGNLLSSRIIDSLQIGYLDENSHIIIGSASFDPSGSIIVAVEEFESNSFPDRSINIHSAWMFIQSNQLLKQIPVEKLYRINEGYYLEKE